MWIILTVPVPPAELNVNILDSLFMSVFYSEVFGTFYPLPTGHFIYPYD